jgi:hypothetical protein
MNSIDILAMRGGHKVISGTTAYGKTDYHFYGFIPNADATFTNLNMGDTDVTPTGVTFYAGIYYGAPSRVAPGYYNEVTLATGSITLVLTQDSPNHY